MSHFAKAAEILARARAGETVPDLDDPILTHAPPPPRVQTGNPARLKEAYRALFRVALAFIANPSKQNRDDLVYKRNYCSSIESECAPVGSPWCRLPQGVEDTTLFAKERALDAQLHGLLELSPTSARWVLLAQKIGEAIESL
jgi:hypothetical protein